MDNNKHPTLSNGKICYIEMPAVDIKPLSGTGEKQRNLNQRNNDVVKSFAAEANEPGP